jgi:hypothetical protein
MSNLRRWRPGITAVVAVAALSVLAGPASAGPDSQSQRPVAVRIASVDGPSNHFGPNSVLSQTSTTVAKIVSNIAGTPVNQESATVSPGSIVTFQVNFTVESPSGTDIRDFFDPNLLVLGGDGCSATTNVPIPTTAAPNAQVVTCDVISTGTSGQLALQFQVNANATQGLTLVNVACAQDVTNGWTNLAFCDSSTVTVGATPPAPTGIVCVGPVTAVLTPSSGSGVTAQVNILPGGQLNAIVNGLVPGQVPILSVQTSAGLQTITGVASGTGPGLGTAIINGTLSGSVSQGAVISLTANNPLGSVVQTLASGTVFCTNNVPLPPPFLPQPPLEFIPPPPPPLLPPPPPRPLMGPPMAAAAAMPGVPVIPEADSLFLLAGGLVALGSLVALRSLRRRRDDGLD